MKRFTSALICALALTAAQNSAKDAKELKYTLIPEFFQNKPGGEQLGPCHGGVVIDKKGNYYVTTDTKRGIVVFDKNGEYVRAFGPTRIHALEIRSERGKEYIYAARPSDHEVVKIDLQGNEIWKITTPTEAGIYKDKVSFNPCAVTVASDGSIFIADGYGSNYVLKYNKNRKFVKAFGGPGKEEGKFQTCHGIAFDPRARKPLLLVCNRNNNRVEHWDLDGNFVRVIQKNLRMPAAVHIRGDYAVFPELQGRVTVIDKAGNIVAQLGDNPNEKQRANFGLPPAEWKDGICNSPHGASLDKNLNVIVSEWSAFGHMHRWDRTK
jgi:DNA-binding beta-propeller fold protein YncE